MAGGDIINYANFKAMYPATSWVATRTSNTGASSWVYVFAPSFEAYAQAKGSGLWGAQIARLNIGYWNGSDWTTVLDWNKEVRASGNSTSNTWRHMYSGGSSGDNPLVHLWRVRVNSAGDGSGSVHLYVGGIERWSEDQYNTYCKGNLLRGNRIGIYTSLTDFIETYSPEAFRGTPIDSTTARGLCN